MKRQILTLVMALVAMLTVTAQKKMVVVIDGQEQEAVEVWRVDEIKFIFDQDGVVTLNDDPDSLDLGLSVRWADRNMGAASPKDKGLLIGWGDTTLTNYSKKLQYFPIENANVDITGGNYDVATQKWATKWHMPTATEIQELIDACNWTWVNDQENDSVGVVGTLKTDETKTIFFPVTGYREGEAEPSEAAKGYYWTGSIAQSSTQYARYISFSEEAFTPAAAADKERFVGLAIRPVLGPVEIPTSIESVVINGVTDKAATVTVTLSGSLKDVTLAGLAFGKDVDNLTTSDTEDASHKILTIGTPLTFPFDNLEHNTTFYVKAYVKKNDGTYLTSAVQSFVTEQAENFPIAQAVDMGLPSGTKWASWNLGASDPKQVPSNVYARFVWGDPTGEVHNTTDFSRIAAANDPAVTANNSVDIAGTKYDIAHMQWGSNWKLPTLADFEELDYYTTWEWYDEGTNRRGWKVTSRLNHNVIYIPAAGYKNADHEIVLTGDNNGYATPVYWISKSASARLAYTVRPSEGAPYDEKRLMYCEASIRPVFKEANQQQEEPQQPEEPIVEPTDPVTNEAGIAVDLGLPSGTKWADRNVGVTNSNPIGEYICWGDTKQREQYKIADYIYYDPVNGYNKYTYLGTNSNQALEYSIGGTEYDAAHVRWGGTWRMPTRAQMNELINECTWTWTNSNGKIGYLVKGKNNNTIFLPAAGRMTQTDSEPQVFSININGYYWIDQAYYGAAESNYNTCGRTLEFDEESKSAKLYRGRHIGLPIRPVQP